MTDDLTMTEMYLNCPVITQVSKVDINYLLGFNFILTEYGYLITGTPPHRGKFLHIIIAERMGLRVDEFEIDHRDLNKLNNQRSNLREATPVQNSRNRLLRADNRLRVKCVSFIPEKNKYRARIHYMGRRRHIGYFETEQEAFEAYCKKGVELFGEFFNPGY